MTVPQTVQLGKSELQVSSIGFGCWPIAGVSSLGVTDHHSRATIRAALDSGINFFDTAYAYGYAGEADRLLAKELRHCRKSVVIASKVGTHYDADRNRIVDGRPSTIVEHTEQTLKRLDIECLDVLYLHQPDPSVPLEDSASAIQDTIARGLVRYAGVSNVTSDQLQQFNSVCPVAVCQPAFNMLQQDSVDDLRGFCAKQGIGIAVYWVLMKGLLAGKMYRDHQFDPADRRLTYPVYQGEAWQHAQDLLDRLRLICKDLECTVAQLVIAWTLAQPAVTVALCGAKRAEQIAETAQAMQLI